MPKVNLKNTASFKTGGGHRNGFGGGGRAVFAAYGIRDGGKTSPGGIALSVGDAAGAHLRSVPVELPDLPRPDENYRLYQRGR